MYDINCIIYQLIDFLKQYLILYSGIVFEIVAILSLHCYWEYDKEMKKQPQKTWFQHKLGQMKNIF